MTSFSDLQIQFESYLNTIQFKKEPKGLYEAIDYILQLGGKRVRPTLVLMGCELFDGKAANALPAAAAIELFHNFSLIHDDIMDHAPLRRGKPTVHEAYDLDTAILSGDAAMVMAYDELIKLEIPKISSAIKLFNKTALEVCEGQQMDMIFETKQKVTTADYLEMIRLKTAVLLGCAIQLGAMMADADEKQQKLIYEFGMETGLAFQLQDDILDTYGDPKTFGKQVGGDILQNKKTFLLLTAFENADPTQLTDLLFWLMKNEPKKRQEKVEAIKKLYDELNVRDVAEMQMKLHFDKALQAVEGLEIDTTKKQVLIDFATSLMKREK
jgi:geranylgeranyl diphosphate synthase type II